MLVARYAGKLELDLKLRDAVRAHQSNLDAIQLSLAMAKILERIILGSSIFVRLTDIIASLMYWTMAIGRASCLKQPNSD